VARSQSYELSGPIAEATLNGLNLDVAFIGVDGIEAKRVIQNGGVFHVSATMLQRRMEVGQQAAPGPREGQSPPA